MFGNWRNRAAEKVPTTCGGRGTHDTASLEYWNTHVPPSPVGVLETTSVVCAMPLLIVRNVPTQGAPGPTTGPGIPAKRNVLLPSSATWPGGCWTPLPVVNP